VTPPDDETCLPLPLSGDTRLFTIVGDPIAQVGSPRLFNACFRRRGARAVLFPSHVTAEGLPAVLAGLRRLNNLDGIVVTIPHKIALMDHADRIEANAARVGAVNAVRREADGTLVADNFDGEGCMRGLEEAGGSVAGRRVLLVGAGGAGSAIAHAVADRGPARLRIHDVHAARLDRLMNSLAAAHPAVDVDAGPPAPEDCHIVINATPLGMDKDDPHPVDPERIRPGATVVDAILKPPVSPLLRAAEARGCTVLPGLTMLAGQVEAVADFFGVANAREAAA